MDKALLTIRHALERVERGDPPAASYLAVSLAYRSIIDKSGRVRARLTGAGPSSEHEFVGLQAHLIRRRAIGLFLRYLRHAAKTLLQ